MKAGGIGLVTLVACAATVGSWGAQESGRASDHGATTSPGLHCQILFDYLPNPLRVRLANDQPEEFRFRIFQSTHATMPPMANARVEVTDASSRQVMTSTTVVLTQRRGLRVLKPGEATDIFVYHRGIDDLLPGTYEASVLLFGDADSKQEKPIAVSPSMAVNIKTKEAPQSALSGVLHMGEKTIMPYLLLDGSDDRCYVKGGPLGGYQTGTRLRVKGELRIKLLDETGKDWRAPGMPAPPPFLKGWVVYMEVREAKEIAEPFGG